MLRPGIIKVIAAVGKGMNTIAKGHRTRINAVAFSVGIVINPIAVRSVCDATRVPQRRR